MFLYSKLKSTSTENKSLTSSLEEEQETLESLESEQKDLEEQLNNLETERKGLEEERNTLESELEFLKSIEPMSVTMYALEDCDTYSKQDESSEKLGGLTTNQEVHVIGQSKETGWYEIEINGSKQYVSNQFLSDTKTQVTQASNSNSGQQSNQGTTQNNNSNNTSQGNSNGTVNSDGSLNLDKLKELGFGKHDLPASSGSAADLGNDSSGNWNDVTIY